MKGKKHQRMSRITEVREALATLKNRKKGTKRDCLTAQRLIKLVVRNTSSKILIAHKNNGCGQAAIRILLCRCCLVSEAREELGGGGVELKQCRKIDSPPKARSSSMATAMLS